MMLKALLVVAFVPLAFCKKEKVHLVGKFTCPSEPSKVEGVKVKLLDKKFGPDDNFGESKTRSDGSFEVEGTASNFIGGGDLRFRVYHDCDDSVPKYQRKWDFKIPKVWIGTSRPVDVGVWNLETVIDEEEEHDLIH